MVTILSKPAAANNWASREYANGRRERKVGAILHWMAGYLPGTTAMFQRSSTGYSTSLGVGSRDGRGNGLEVHRYVPADGYAYGSYNEWADRAGESIEIENDASKPYPGKPTPEVHELVAQLLAHLCVVEDWPLIGGRRQLVLGDFPDHRFYRKPVAGFGVAFNVTTHRSMALKDCPGTTDVAWIVERGNQILTPTTIPTPQEDYDMGTIRYIERVDANGKHDGEWMIVGRDLGPEYGHGGEVLRRGFRVTNNWDQASIWAALYGIGVDCEPIKRTRDPYIAIQAYAAGDSLAYDGHHRALASAG